jgi:hypothetical protein
LKPNDVREVYCTKVNENFRIQFCDDTVHTSKKIHTSKTKTRSKGKNKKMSPRRHQRNIFSLKMDFFSKPLFVAFKMSISRGKIDHPPKRPLVSEMDFLKIFFRYRAEFFRTKKVIRQIFHAKQGKKSLNQLPWKTIFMLTGCFTWGKMQTAAYFTEMKVLCAFLQYQRTRCQSLKQNDTYYVGTLDLCSEMCRNLQHYEFSVTNFLYIIW